MPVAGFTSRPPFPTAPLPGLVAAAVLPPSNAIRLHARSPTGFGGRAPSRGAVFLTEQYDGAWRLHTPTGLVPPQRVFGWAMRFPVAAAGPAQLRPAGQTARRIEIAIIALLWLAALWVTRKPSRA